MLIQLLIICFSLSICMIHVHYDLYCLLHGLSNLSKRLEPAKLPEFISEMACLSWTGRRKNGWKQLIHVWNGHVRLDPQSGWASFVNFTIIKSMLFSCHHLEFFQTDGRATCRSLSFDYCRHHMHTNRQHDLYPKWWKSSILKHVTTTSMKYRHQYEYIYKIKCTLFGKVYDWCDTFIQLFYILYG